jgi:hypothetical protein
MANKYSKIALYLQVNLREDPTVDDLSEITSETDYSVKHFDSDIIKDTELLGEQEEGIVAINVKLKKSLNENEIETLVSELEIELKHEDVEEFFVIYHDYKLTT